MWNIQLFRKYLLHSLTTAQTIHSKFDIRFYLFLIRVSFKSLSHFFECSSNDAIGKSFIVFYESKSKNKNLFSPTAIFFKQILYYSMYCISISFIYVFYMK